MLIHNLKCFVNRTILITLSSKRSESKSKSPNLMEFLVHKEVYKMAMAGVQIDSLNKTPSKVRQMFKKAMRKRQ